MPVSLPRRRANPGLSPRVRGNQGDADSCMTPMRVYPRACGGTFGVQGDEIIGGDE